MKVHGTVTVNAPQAEVWRVLIDPVQLCKVIPGCEQARQLDATHYEAVISVRVQFMTIRSQAKGTLLEADPPRHMLGELVGEPTAMAGAFRARVTIDLKPVSGGTSIHYFMDMTLLGRLASLGEALVGSTSKQLASQFAENLAVLFKNRP